MVPERRERHHGDPIHRLLPGVDYQQRRPGQGDGRPGLLLAEARVERREDGAQLGHGGEDRYHIDGGRRPHRNPVAACNPVVAEHSGRAVGPVLELAERERRVVQRGGHPPGHGPRRVGEDVAHQ